MDTKITDNLASKQYELQVDDLLVRIEYIKAQNRIFLTHTEVPVELEGKGFGSSIVKGVLELIEQKGLTLIPMCPFVALYIKRHPEWKKLILKGINVD
jgi:uncharacterized protein